jgi:hypothetical protein
MPFNPPDIERQLEHHVEGPANKVLDKLRAGQFIGAKERAQLTFYMGTMLKRVPTSRLKGQGLLPAVLEETVQAVKALIIQAGKDGVLMPETQARRLAEADETAENPARNTPVSVIERVNCPWPSEQMIGLIYFMTWRLCTTTAPSFFLITDNPVFIFEYYGLGQEDAEIVFPTSATLPFMGAGSR